MDNTEVCNAFMHDTKKDLGECFDRIRKLELTTAVQAEKDRQVLDKMDDLMSFFKAHDEHEMAKYDSMNKDIKWLTRIVYMTLGGGAVVLFVLEFLK